ncbi:MAG: glycosyltransferase, partial [Acidimicrobiales bacterium]
MRVLVATTAGSGHFGPLVPFARALVDRGHDVVVAAPASFAAAVDRAGFVHQPFADAPAEELGAVFGRLRAMSYDEANATVVREVFGRIDTRAALPEMQAFVERWRPELVVREPSEFSSYIAAEAAGVPHVQVCVGLAAFEDRIARLVEEPIEALGGKGAGAGLRSVPRLSLVPPTFEDPSAPGLALLRFRADDASAAGGPLPDWWRGLSGPLVYVTFGSVAANLGLFPDLYRAAAAALAGLPIRVLLTVGDAGDPALIGSLPDNVHVETWWPQQDVMAH